LYTSYERAKSSRVISRSSRIIFRRSPFGISSVSEELSEERFEDKKISPEIFAAVNWHGGVPAVLRLQTDMRPFLANDSKTQGLKKNNEIFSFYDRKHYAPGTISTSRNPTNVL
jgi:hypothetical protein